MGCLGNEYPGCGLVRLVACMGGGGSVALGTAEGGRERKVESLGIERDLDENMKHLTVTHGSSDLE
jgi:hypothetical protein